MTNYEKEWIDPEEIFEEEDEDLNNSEENILNEKPFDADKIRYDIKSISVRQMNDMIKENQLDLYPGFQRREVWKENKRKSLLIESLMLRIPLPGFYVYEDENSVWHVVDGLQRMSTIRDFLEDKFSLSGLEYLEHSNRKKFFELEQKYKNRITQTSLMINVIDSRTPAQVKLEIFRRINTGGVPLNAQEIRNSIGTKMVRVFLKNLSTCEEFQKATNGGISNQRMQAQELVLRFIAFYDAFDFDNLEVDYKKGMDTFLDKAFERLNKADAQQLKKYDTLFKRAMKNATLLFGNSAFRRITGSDKLPPYNKSLFTCESVILAHYKYEDLKNANLGDKILKRLTEEIRNNLKFNESLSKGTGDYSSLQTQFKTIKTIISEMIDDDY